MLKKITLLQLVVVGAFIMGAILALTHSAQSIVSFDEGFHGGAALFIHDFILYVAHGREGASPNYLIGEFFNGLALYPPLWTLAASFLALLFGPTLEVFRFATTLFYIGSIIWTYWFIQKAQNSRRAGLITAALIATVPMIMVYSNLMMLEIPLLLGVSTMVGFFYMYSMDLLPRSRWVIVAGCAIFFLAPLTKLAAIGVALGTIISFVVLASLLFWKQRFYRHFLKPELLLFLVLTGVAIGLFVKFEELTLHANLIDFHLKQSHGAEHANPIVETLLRAWKNKAFYLKDFFHMPILALIWFGSVVGYAVWKRNALGLLIILWTGVSYILFSGVLPQVPQYLMPIYAPLAIGTGLFVAAVSEVFKDKRWKMGTALGMAIVLVAAQVQAMQFSEGTQWRTTTTSQIQAAQYIEEHGKPGDRVLSWNDGTTFSVRSEVLPKEIHIKNAIQPVCRLALEDNYNWAINTEHQVPQPTEADWSILTSNSWEIAAVFEGDHTTTIYRNTTVTWPLVYEAERAASSDTLVADSQASGGMANIASGKTQQPAFWGCYRMYPLGKHMATFSIKAPEIPEDIPDTQEVAKLEYAAYPNGEYSLRSVTAAELRKPGYQVFEVPFERLKIDLQGELRVFVTAPFDVWVDRIEVGPR